MDHHDIVLRNGLAAASHILTTMPEAPASDFSAVPSAWTGNLFIWDQDAPLAHSFTELGAALERSGDLFRHSAHGSGLLLASNSTHVPLTAIIRGSQLAPLIVDRLQLIVVKNGKSHGAWLPPSLLDTMLRTEVFLRQFQPVDRIARSPMFFGEFELTKPGYNDRGRGQRILYLGELATIENSPETIHRFAASVFVVPR